jgi:hypothetical protein
MFAIRYLHQSRGSYVCAKLVFAVPLSFATNIRPLFRDADVDAMQALGLDLSSYDEVKARASEIYDRLEDGSMPCDDAWPAEVLALFRRWINEGMLP